MEIKPSSEKRFALLIDADNVSAKYLKPILDELSKYGTVTYKRIYGDWTLTLHAKWKDALLKASITPIQQFGYTQGKNATDSAMIIDAMDILYTKNVDGFCIVSSDSDFTRLASRLRESGVLVIGMGEKKTPVPFRTACDVFTTLELLIGERGSRRRGGKGQAVSADDPTATREQIEQAVIEIITDNQNNGKATGLGEIGSRLQKRYPDFDVRNYGTNLLSKLLNEFEGVTISKDRSNVVVELSDGILHDETTEEEEPSAEQAAVDQPEDESSASERPRNRRRRGGRRNKRAEASTAEPEETTQEDSGNPKVEADPAADQPVDQQEASDQTDQTQRPVEEPEEDPDPPARQQAPAVTRRRHRTRKRESAQQNEAEQATQNASDQQAEDASEAVDQPPADEDVKAFICELIAAAGEEGAAVGPLGRKIRTRFRTFRLRERGFQNLRAYLATIEGVSISKSGREHFARLS